MSQSTKERAAEIYKAHLELAATDGRLFRKTVMDQLMSELGVSLASAATHYNNCKKQAAPVEGLGRPPVSKNLKKPGGGKAKNQLEVAPDDECFAVMELVKNGAEFTVGRYQSFLLQGDASEKFDEKIEAWPFSSWVMIQGLGPNSGETYKLSGGEKEIKKYEPKKVEA